MQEHVRALQAQLQALMGPPGGEPMSSDTFPAATTPLKAAV